MQKIPSTVLIYQRGGAYYCDATGCFGGGYSGAYAGKTPEEAALFAEREKGRYISNNSAGGQIIIPAEVREALKAATIKA